MDSESEIMFEYKPFFKVYKDERIEKIFDDSNVVPPGTDPDTGVSSKDVEISSEDGVSARVFTPSDVAPGEKLPLLVYYHGGGYVVGSPSSTAYHNFAAALVKEAKIAVVSIAYRLAPETPILEGYEDSWAAMQWVASHADASGPEAVLNENVNWARVFIGGDCVGATIAYTIVVRATELGSFGPNDDASSLRLVAAIFIHPYFLIPVGDDEVAALEKLWLFFVPPEFASADDPSVNPSRYPNVGKMVCEKYLTCVAEKDELREAGLLFHRLLVVSKAMAEDEYFDMASILENLFDPKSSRQFYETEGETHDFHLLDSDSDKAVALRNRIASFITEFDSEN